MVLRIPDKWLWDFWFAKDGPDIHIYYLQAPRDLPVEQDRHWYVSIGHAVSQDLIHWKVLPDALIPSVHPGDWDDYTTWTGSIFMEGDTWYMFYTGTNRVEKGLIQRIGLATSGDLVHWDRYLRNPSLEPDKRWYELLDLDLWQDQTWRDPWVFRHNEKYHAYITARANTGDRTDRGVIAHAISSDLLNWDIHPPITESGEFSYMEVPQLVEIEGLWYLFFSVTHDKYAASRLQRPEIKPHTGTHYLVADNPMGPFEFLTDEFMVGDEVGSLYSGKVVQNPKGDWVFIAFRMFGPDNQFYGDIIDPLPISIKSDGQLSVEIP